MVSIDFAEQEKKKLEKLTGHAFQFLIDGVGEYTLDEEDAVFYQNGYKKCVVSPAINQKDNGRLNFYQIDVRFFNDLDESKATESLQWGFAFGCVRFGQFEAKCEMLEYTPYCDLIPMHI